MYCVEQTRERQNSKATVNLAQIRTETTGEIRSVEGNFTGVEQTLIRKTSRLYENSKSMILLRSFTKSIYVNEILLEKLKVNKLFLNFFSTHDYQSIKTRPSNGSDNDAARRCASPVFDN